MIPASYLYKDAFRQHWGDEFDRHAGHARWSAHQDAGHWPLPPLLASLLSLLSRPAPSARPVDCDDFAPCPPAAA